MSGFGAQARLLAGWLDLTPGWREVLALEGAPDRATAGAIFDEAARFAQDRLAPLAATGDRAGCRLEGGRVQLPDGYGPAWHDLARQGWLGMDLPEDRGGQGLPLAVQTVCQTLFDRAAPAFMMGPAASRAGAHLLLTVAPDIARNWVPRIADGSWATTICISEPGAGSDVGRVRTRAVRDGGIWRMTGEKVWISFGDHDAAERIGHLAIARTSEAPGTRGLSLFLVPDRTGDGARNGVTVERIEDKLGLHGSPTCALRFDGAEATLLGAEDRGLPQLFAMIQLMRLQTGCQGFGQAMAARDLATDYAAGRRQGGPADAPPVAIASHPDVRRQLAVIGGAVLPLGAALLELATSMDLARCHADPETRRENGALASVLLPLVKTFGGETGFASASGAIQVLGGTGYTRDWPAERLLRDTRILTIYEGTTGMQAQDLLHRRLRKDGGTSVRVLLERARREAEVPLGPMFDAFATLSREMAELDPEAAGWAADGYMRALWTVVSGWMCVRLRPAAAEADARALDHRMATLTEEFALHRAACRAG